MPDAHGKFKGIVVPELKGVGWKQPVQPPIRSALKFQCPHCGAEEGTLCPYTDRCAIGGPHRDQ